MTNQPHTTHSPPSPPSPPEINKEVLLLALKKPLLHVMVKEWKDVHNGNSYWSSRAWIAGQEVARMRFQYGYERHGLHIPLEALATIYFQQGDPFATHSGNLLKELGVDLNYEKFQKCTEREVRKWGEWS